MQHNIRLKHARPRHPQNQGQLECVNQTITRRMTKYQADKESNRWIDILDTIVMKHNTGRHRSNQYESNDGFL